MTTIHEDALTRAMHRDCCADRELAADLFQVHRALREGDHIYSQDIVDAAVQMWEGYPIQLLDAYCFMRIWSRHCQGHLVTISIPVGQHASRNDQVAENQRGLDKLPEEFKATFNPAAGRGADNDGTLSWSIPICMERYVADLDHVERPGVRSMWWVEPGSVPLEVGYTRGSKSVMHLAMGGFARWPYGYDRIILIVNHPSSEQGYIKMRPSAERVDSFARCAPC